jgi:DNA-binding MarR family transcriptional regulator
MIRRRRNSCLAVIETMRRSWGDVSLNEAVTFLYICENEGVNLSELIQLTGLSLSSASRASRRLLSKDAAHALPPALGLVAVAVQSTDKRSRVFFLTDAGRAARDEMNAIIAAAVPIVRLNA